MTDLGHYGFLALLVVFTLRLARAILRHPLG